MDAASLADLKDVLELYQTQYEATDKLWAYFSTVSLALLGFCLGSDRMSDSPTEARIALAAYLVFCGGNFTALFLAQRQLNGFAELVHKTAGLQNVELLSIYPVSPVGVALFYWAVVATICGAVLLITRRRQQAALGRPSAAASDSTSAA